MHSDRSFVLGSLSSTILTLLPLASAAQQPVPPPAAPKGTSASAARASSALEPHLLVRVLPEAAACAAPEWIVPGMRLTYFSSVAEVKNAAGAVGLEKNADGSFRETNPVGLGTGGTGWDFCDVIAVEPDAIVLGARSYRNTRGNEGPCLPNGGRAWLVHPSGCDFFLHPTLLRKLPQTTGPIASWIEAEIEHRGTKYHAARHTVEIENSRQSAVYDLESGVQLTHNSSTKTVGGAVFKRSGQDYEQQDNTTRVLANNQFHGARQLELPWIAAPVPAWAKKMKRARYRGSRVDSGTPEMGLGRTMSQITVELVPTKVGATYVVFEMKFSEQLQGIPPLEPAIIQVATGPGSLDGLWIAPEALSQLRTGQPIDRDPSTGVEIFVKHVGQGRDGSPIVVIAARNVLFESTWTYSGKDGRLLGSQTSQRSEATRGSLVLSLELVDIS